jgi:hypothetical protein
VNLLGLKVCRLKTGLYLQSNRTKTLSLQNNNFDLLRVLFATIVFLVNAYALSGSLKLKPLADIFSSEIAVKSFLQ